MSTARAAFNYKQVRAQIHRELNVVGVSDQLMKLQADRESRLARSFTPEVILFEPGEEEGVAPLAGSVLMIAARKGNAIFEGLRRAYRARDVEALSKLGAQLKLIVEKRRVVSVARVVSQVKKAPALFDLRYKTATLAPNVCLVGGVEIGTISLPYNGGHLVDSDFSIVEYHRTDAPRDYDVLLVKRPPRLSELEREVLQKLPAAESGLNIGSIAACPGFTVVIVIIFVAVTVAGKSCFGLRDRLAEVSLPPSTIAKLGPAATARQLVSMRRELFARYGA